MRLRIDRVSGRKSAMGGYEVKCDGGGQADRHWLLVAKSRAVGITNGWPRSLRPAQQQHPKQAPVHGITL